METRSPNTSMIGFSACRPARSRPRDTIVWVPFARPTLSSGPRSRPRSDINLNEQRIPRWADVFDLLRFAVHESCRPTYSMNKAFVREPEPDGRAYCPKCSAFGTAVGSLTLNAHVLERSRKRLGDARRGKKCTRRPNAIIAAFPASHPTHSRPGIAIFFSQTGASRWQIRSFNLGICCSPSWPARTNGKVTDHDMTNPIILEIVSGYI